MKLGHALLFASLTLAAGSASASLVKFVGSFGPEGPNSPTGTGSVQIVYDSSFNTLAFDVVFSGMSSPSTVAHVHCCTAAPNVGNAGVVVEPPTLFNFPVGVTSGHYVETINLDEPGNVNPNFVNANGSLAAAIQTLVAGMGNGRAYFNIHTQANPGGEIRARLQVPEPGTGALLLAALGAGLALRRRPLSRAPRA